MADLTVSTASLSATSRGMRTVVFTSQNVGYWFQIGTGTDMMYCKTTDGGKTWGAEVAILAGTIESFDVWYDQWTPGNTGRDIHIWMVDGGTTDAVQYCRLNTTNDSQTDVTVVGLGSTAAGRGQFVSGCRARGGNLLCAFDIDAGAEHGMYKSTDNGVTWSAMTDPVEATIDQCKLFPGNLADPNDIWLLYHDASTNELTIKTYDDSGNSFAESGALTMAENITDATGQYGFDGSIRHSDGHLIFAYMDTYDGAGASSADFKVYDFDGTTLTALTDIVAGTDNIYYPSVFLNQDQPDYIYVAYLGVTAGTSTFGVFMPALYALSKNRGLTWTTDIAYSTSTTDYRQCWTPLNGEKFQVFWMDISAADIITNHDNSIDFGFTSFNNYQSPRAVGQNNTGVISINGGRG